MKPEERIVGPALYVTVYNQVGKGKEVERLLDLFTQYGVVARWITGPSNQSNMQSITLRSSDTFLRRWVVVQQLTTAMKDAVMGGEDLNFQIVMEEVGSVNSEVSEVLKNFELLRVQYGLRWGFSNLASGFGVGSVVFVITQLSRAGAETQVVRVAAELRKRGWKVGVVSLMKAEAFVEELKSQGVQVYELGMKRGDWSGDDLSRMVNILERDRYSQMICFLFHASLLGATAGRLAGLPRIYVSMRGEEQKRSRRFLQRLLLRCEIADGLVTNSKFLSNQVVSTDLNRTNVIPNLIDLSDWPYSPPKPQPGAPFRWVALGNLMEEKDYPTLLRAVGELKQAREDWVLEIAGAPFNKIVESDVKRLCAELGLEKCVTFKGQVTDVAAFLKLGNGYVMSSKSEGLPNSMIEAMAVGLPVVSTRAGGIPELVVHGKSGFLVDVGDPIALALQMGRLMDATPEQVSSLTQNARKHVEDYCSIERVIKRWEALLTG